jgi:hypothetical protein
MSLYRMQISFHFVFYSKKSSNDIISETFDIENVDQVVLCPNITHTKMIFGQPEYFIFYF